MTASDHTFASYRKSLDTGVSINGLRKFLWYFRSIYADGPLDNAIFLPIFKFMWHVRHANHANDLIFYENS